ncbi:Pyridoxal-dependent decarboxylase domain-containing protein 1 [Lamellibrachia satsuma]|nr:Pyridoxal-dependent decarboxylase domain-containing protein 1 [Lamellibrachia satsuma]
MASEKKAVNGDASFSPKSEMTTASDETATDSVSDQVGDDVRLDANPRVGLPGGPKTTLEECFYKHLVSRMAHMQASVDPNGSPTSTSGEGDERKRNRMDKHVPETLPAMGQDIRSIIKQVEALIVSENHEAQVDSAKFMKDHLRELQHFEEVAVLSHSLGAYISTLELQHLKKFAEDIVADMTHWIRKVFRFPDSLASFHEDDREGIVKMCRFALHRKYPRFATDGYGALYTRPPVIYMSSAARPGVAQFLCSQLGLPLSSIHTVGCSSDTGSIHRMDVDALVKCIDEDIVSGKTPVMLLAHAGTQLLGQVDRLDLLDKLCREKEIWLHVEGNNLATLALSNLSAKIQQARRADSLSLDLGGWTGLPFMPHITLYKTALDAHMAKTHLGSEGIVQQIASSVELAKMMNTKTEMLTNIQNVVTYEIANPMVVFRYEQVPQQESAGESDAQPRLSPKDPYYDALNVWLAEILRRDVPQVHVGTVEIENVGLCVRFAPLESAHVYATTKEALIQWIMCLDQQIKILDATVRQRLDFQDIVEAQDNLRLITLRTWAGLGAIQYIPEKFFLELDNLSEVAKKEINALNINLVHQLKSADTAFSLGHSEEGLACARFGLITEETDLEELIALVYTTGKEVEESSKFLETMAEVVRQGIDKANKDLETEEQNKLAQEGVIRQIPLVSSLVNWWSPPAKAAIKGRMFNLASGKIESTEKTYECHMQVQEMTPDLSPNMRSYPRKASLKPRQHRTSSSCSNPTPLLESSTAPPDSNTAPQDTSGAEDKVTTEPPAALTPAEEEVFEVEAGKTA